MVERKEDGTWWPYLLDFGLAREVDSNTQTVSDSVEGTPSYMAPEQARGETRALDRRTDVYGLGAALYTILCGQPPFTGNPTEVLIDVVFNDPPPLRTFDPSVPADLETITLKCLEKDPGRRYQTAKGLADDLLRFLQGSRIVARPPSLAQRLAKFARRHKLLVASAATALVASLTLGGVALHARWQAAAQARLAQELGQDIKEAELFMRAAYSLPLHDIAREQVVVRKRMGRLLGKLSAANASSAAALRYAIGRGHLVLREYPQAQAALEQAWEGGYRTSEARLALGLALGERYRQELEQAQRVGDKAWIAARERELQALYLKPALSFLAGISDSVEAPGYVQGLLAFYRKEYEPALALVLRAESEAPWLAEPLKLEGDVYQVQGIKQLDSGHHKEARALLLRAAERHQAAVAISRSDSQLFDAEALDWIRIMEIDADTGSSLAEAEKGALQATEHAIAAAPRDPYGLQLRSWAYWRMGFTKLFRGQDVESDFKQSVELAQKAIALDPSDWQSSYYYALAIGIRANTLYAQEEDASGINQRAIEALQNSIKINKNFAWAWNDLGTRYMDQFGFQASHGALDSSLFASADQCFAQAAELDPAYPNPIGNRLAMRVLMVDFLLQHGRNIDEQISTAMKYAQQILSIRNDDYLTYTNIAALEMDRLESMSLSGSAPDNVIAQVAKTLERAQTLNPEDVRMDDSHALFHFLRAVNELHAARDPSAAIAAGLQAVAAGAKKDANNYDLAVHKARLLILSGRTLGNDKQADGPLGEAVASAGRAVELHPKDAEAHTVLCEALRYAALARQGSRKLKREESLEIASFIERGLRECSAALNLNPTMATAHGNRGVLLLLQAQREPVPAARQRLAAQAVEEIGKALKENQRLQPDYGPLLLSAQAIATPTK
jgi:serine/threonine-protein kinase